MNPMTFEDLETWKKARQAVRKIYELTRAEALCRDFGVCAQVQRVSNVKYCRGLRTRASGRKVTVLQHCPWFHSGGAVVALRSRRQFSAKRSQRSRFAARYDLHW